MGVTNMTLVRTIVVLVSIGGALAVGIAGKLGEVRNRQACLYWEWFR
jgi:hypothetical protein